MDDSTLDDGDVARLLMRVADLLRQVTELQSLPRDNLVFMKNNCLFNTRYLSERDNKIFNSARLEKQVVRNQNLLPDLRASASAALEGMDRKPIADLSF